MSAVTNGDRCHRGENAIRAGAVVAERGPKGGRAYPEKPDDVIDTLANIAHYCRRESLDFGDLCRIAAMHTVNETNGDTYDMPADWLGLLSAANIPKPGEVVMPEHGHELVMVLDDGATYSGLEGCKMVRLTSAQLAEIQAGDASASDLEQGDTLATFRTAS